MWMLEILIEVVAFGTIPKGLKNRGRIVDKK